MPRGLTPSWRRANVLATYDFGCAVGNHSNHVCFCALDAPSEAEARAQLPQTIASKATIVEVGKFTPDQVRSFHSS
jgi:hypothetical protein